MPRTRHLLAALVATIAVVVAACGSSAASPLTDPSEILTKSLTSLDGIKTAHLQLDLSGKVSADLTGTGSSGQLDLAGTNATVDLDVAGKKLHAVGSVPAALNTGGEVIVTADAVYYKLTGPLSQSDKFTKLPMSSLSGSVPSLSPNPSASGAAAAAIDEIQKALGQLPNKPTLQASQKCGDADCYDVQIKVSAADLAKLDPSLASQAPAQGSATVDIFARTDNLRPAKLVIALDAGSQGSVTLTVNATYDGSVNIQAPSADQVTEGTGGFPFPIPSIMP